MLKKLISLILISSALLISIQELSAEKKKVVLTKKRVRLYAGRRLLYLTKRLSLTKEQQKKIRIQLYEMEDRFMKQRADIKVMEFKLALFIKNNEEKRAEMHRMIREIYDKKSDFVIAMIDHMMKLYAVLTPEQKKILEREMSPPGL